jgi:N-acetylneuraminate synthase
MAEIIAEIAQAHDGSLGILHSYIDAIAKTGASTIKFQTHIASAESSEFEQFRVNFSYVDKTRFEYWKRMEFSFEQWVGIKEHCDKAGLEFLSSPFSIAAFELLERLGVSRYKIASGEVNNYLLLDKIISTGKPVLISSGMSTMQELRDAVNHIKVGKNELSVFQCTTAYPTPPEECGLNMITDFKNEFECKVGLSDHSGEIYAGLAAIALGADMIEVHATFSKDIFGPDTKSSLSMSQLVDLVQGNQFITTALNSPAKKIASEKNETLKQMFGKSLAVNKTIRVGQVLTINDLETKKPAGKGISAADYYSVIGKAAEKELPANSFLNKSDINDK